MLMVHLFVYIERCIKTLHSTSWTRLQPNNTFHFKPLLLIRPFSIILLRSNFLVIITITLVVINRNIEQPYVRFIHLVQLKLEHNLETRVCWVLVLLFKVIKGLRLFTFTFQMSPTETVLCVYIQSSLSPAYASVVEANYVVVEFELSSKFGGLVNWWM